MLNGYRNNETGLLLPAELVASASMIGSEYAWRRKDLPGVAALAENLGLASAGWKVLFRTSDGDLDLCWNSYYPDGKREDESWPSFLGRSWEETRRSWHHLFKDEGLVDEGRKVFRLLKETESPGMLPSEALWFVLYFTRSTGKEREAKKSKLPHLPINTEIMDSSQQESIRIVPLWGELEERPCQAASRSGPRTNAPGKSF